MARLIDYAGVLAVDLGRITNWTEPQAERTLILNRKIKASDWDHLLGCEVKFQGNQGRVWPIGAARPTFVDTTDWEHVTETEPIKKPRRGQRQGQRYDWEWSCGQWRRVYQ